MTINLDDTYDVEAVSLDRDVSILVFFPRNATEPR
jgi:hypothetical protein